MQNRIALKLMPGGELNFRADLMKTAPDEIVSYAMQRKFALIDLWADKLPLVFSAIRAMAAKSQGMTGDPSASGAASASRAG